MTSLEADLATARSLDVEELADAIEDIGFECTRCGECCTAHDGEEHIATVTPEEVRALQSSDRDWRDVAQPVPFGLAEDGSGETFEWALQTDTCGDCRFYAEGDQHGTCTVYENRPLICQTYPFSVDLAGSTKPAADVVEGEGGGPAPECEGLGRAMSRGDARQLAQTLKRRTIRDLEEAIAVRDRYEPVDLTPGETVVHDAEGAKRVDGRPFDP
ncbi:MAG: YkgJ family cysteine cluster protein [Halobacteriales archaeon]|nr:YkgJ family cysteine cluster protein [Halobacteriales archaeon]